MFKGRVGIGAANKCSCFVDALRAAQARLVVEECVVGYLEEPRTELPLVLIACAGKIRLHQCILRQVVGIVFLATAEGEQETSECLLLTLNMGDKYVSCHEFASAISFFSSASISLASIFFPLE